MKTAAEEIRESIAELEKRYKETQSELTVIGCKITELTNQAAKLTEAEQ